MTQLTHIPCPSCGFTVGFINSFDNFDGPQYMHEYCPNCNHRLGIPIGCKIFFVLILIIVIIVASVLINDYEQPINYPPKVDISH